jgi:DNA-binding PadR family transcriptional regulator
MISLPFRNTIPRYFCFSIKAKKKIDNYIERRYIMSRYIERRYIGQQYIGGYHMAETIVLTEATYYILLALYQPRHGYGIMQQVEELSNGRVKLAAGTLYGALNTMVDKKWIIQLPVVDGSRKKNYQITPEGLIVLKNEIERLRELVKNGDEILGGS